MTVVADSRPPGVNVPFRPGNPLSVTFTGWTAGSLTGRTFTSALGALALEVTVIGDTIVVEATEAQTATLDAIAPWALTETTGGGTVDLLVGDWAPSALPGSTNTVVPVAVDSIEVEVTVTSSQTPIAPILARQGQVVTWPAASAWTDLFDATPVSNPTDSTPVLTATGGYGVATHGVPENANAEDRRIYFLEGSDCSDCEVRLDWEIVAANTQVGIALRGDDDTAVVVWSNIVFGVNATLILGVWEYDGVGDLLQTNQIGSITGYPVAVATATGDGVTVTVRTRLPHGYTPGATASLVGVGAFGNVTVASVVSDTIFTFASATAGSWTGGTAGWLFTPGRRKVAVRLIGNTLTAKQWLPTQDEPAWDDPTRAVSASLPATLAGSGGPPPASGRIGVVVAHLGTTGQVRVGDLQVRNLDPLDGRPSVPVDPDTNALDLVGVQTSRVDDLVNYPINPSPRNHNLIGWTYDPIVASSSSLLTSGVLYLAKVQIDRVTTLSNVLWGISPAAATPVAGQNWVGVYSSAGARLTQAGVDADVTSTAVKTTAVTPVLVPPGFVWVAFLFNASTPPSILRSVANTGLNNAGVTGAAARAASRGTGQTTLPASFTPSTSTLLTFIPWAAVS